MRSEGRVDRLVVGDDRDRRSPSELDRRHPLLPVSQDLLGPQLRTARDQLGQIRDGLHVARVGDPDEPVRVQVVAEEKRGVPIRRGEQPRASVVDEVPLVDRLEPEPEALAERGRRTRPRAPARGAGAARLPTAGSRRRRSRRSRRTRPTRSLRAAVPARPRRGRPGRPRRSVRRSPARGRTPRSRARRPWSATRRGRRRCRTAHRLPTARR